MSQISVINIDRTTIGPDMYFVRLTDDKECFLHILNATTDQYDVMAKRTYHGAAVYSKADGEIFIQDLKNQTGADNLELVQVMEILKNEQPLN